MRRRACSKCGREEPTTIFDPCCPEGGVYCEFVQWEELPQERSPVKRVYVVEGDTPDARGLYTDLTLANRYVRSVLTINIANCSFISMAHAINL